MQKARAGVIVITGRPTIGGPHHPSRLPVRRDGTRPGFQDIRPTRADRSPEPSFAIRGGVEYGNER